MSMRKKNANKLNSQRSMAAGDSAMTATIVPTDDSHHFYDKLEVRCLPHICHCRSIFALVSL